MTTKGREPWWLRIRDTLTLSEDRFALTEETAGLRATARGQATDLATTVLVKLGIAKPPISIEDVAAKLGIVLRVTDIDGGEFTYESAMDARQHLDDGSAPQVWASKNLDWKSQRLAWAHAMGHLLLHPYAAMRVRTCTWYEHMEDQMELEAWRFAHGLLIPLWMVQRMRSFKGSAMHLAFEFQVPEKAMERRLQLLID